MSPSMYGPCLFRHMLVLIHYHHYSITTLSVEEAASSDVCQRTERALIRDLTIVLDKDVHKSIEVGIY